MRATTIRGRARATVARLTRLARLTLLALLALLALVRAAAAAPPKRAIPDYDGRPPAATTAADVARTAARFVLFPIRVVVDYVVRRPLGRSVAAAERSPSLGPRLRGLLVRRPSRTMSISPIVFYDFGFQGSIGFRMQWTDGFATPGSKFTLKLNTGGIDWWRGDTTMAIAAPARFRGLTAGFEGNMSWRPDAQVYGLGPRTSEASRARYLDARFGVTAYAGWRALSLTAATTTTYAGHSDYERGRSVEDQLAAGALAAAPPGYGRLAVTRRFGARFSLDTRDDRAAGGNGARLDGTVERVRDAAAGTWLHVDATLGAALELDRVGEHLLDLRLRVELVDAPAGTAPSFLELASIGGNRDLRGFSNGRGRDASAAALTLDYQWPLAAMLDATLYLGTGNVFGRRLSGLTAGALRGSAGLGLGLGGLTPDRQLEVVAALGTDPFAGGLSVSSFRLSFGYAYDY